VHAELTLGRGLVVSHGTVELLMHRANIQGVTGRPERSFTPIRAEFGSWAFTDRAKASGLVPSMGSVGDCFDNSMIEAFWSRMQVELLDRQSWRTRIELANAIFEYLEIWHNRRRRHSALGWVSPLEFENRSKIVVA
jgi:transposase InsO family protein